VALGGELSIVGALVAGHFAGAHQKFARGVSPADSPAPNATAP
jgi:hydroxymethylglutaryl-CoA reductase